jgi:hypothetical protein
MPDAGGLTSGKGSTDRGCPGIESLCVAASDLMEQARGRLSGRLRKQAQAGAPARTHSLRCNGMSRNTIEYGNRFP